MKLLRICKFDDPDIVHTLKQLAASEEKKKLRQSVRMSNQNVGYKLK